MKKLVLVLVLASSTLAQAGEKTGNGGIGVVCRTNTGEIRSAELLDLYEARKVEGWIDEEGVKRAGVYVHNKDSAALWALSTAGRAFYVQVSPNAYWPFVSSLTDVMRGFLSETNPRALNPKTKMYQNGKELDHTTLSAIEAFSLRRENPRTVGKIRSIDRDQRLAPTSDYSSAIIPKGCAFEQIATYTNDNELLIDPELFDALDVINQGALFFHEAVWAVHRQAGLTSSDLARKFVGATFARFINVTQRTRPFSELEPLTRRVVAIGHLTLKLNYNQTDGFVFDLLPLDLAQRGQTVFGYDLTGAKIPSSVTCQSSTKWHDWTTDTELTVINRNANEPYMFEELTRIPLEIGIIGGGQVVPEYGRLRYTTITPKISCSSKTALLPAKFDVDFTIRRGTQVIYRKRIGQIELGPIGKSSSPVTGKPVFFH